MATSNRNWLAGTAGNLVSALNQVWDPTGIAYNTIDNSIIGTGVWRNMMPSDVAGGGGGNVTVTNTAPIPVSGVVQAAVTINSVAVTGIVTINSGTYTPTISVITGSQTQIPAGARSSSVAVISGYAYVNGSGPILAGTSMSFGGYDGHFLSSVVLNVGATGNTGAPCNVLVIYEL